MGDTSFNSTLSLLVSDLCQHLEKSDKDRQSLPQKLSQAAVELRKLDKSVPTIAQEDIESYLQWIDLDFIGSQRKTSKKYTSELEAAIYALYFTDQQKIWVSPWQILWKLNKDLFKDLDLKPQNVSNYEAWKIYQSVEEIQIPPFFSRLAEKLSLSYGQLLQLKNSPLYYFLYQQSLVSLKRVDKKSRLIISNYRQLTFHLSVKPKISIIIPVYGAYDLLNQALMALHRAMKGRELEYEMICVDDCSPGYSEKHYELYEGIVAIKTPQNLGFSGACNFAAEVAKGEYILLLNSDTIVCENAIPAALAMFTRDEKTAVVGSRLLNLEGSLQEAGGIVWANGDPANFGWRAPPRLPEYEFVRQVDYVSGAALFVKKAVWDELGGFDMRFSPAYYEDTDFCITVKSLGYQVMYCPLSNVIHAEGGTNGTDLESGVKSYQIINQKKFLDKWKGWLSDNQPEYHDFPAHLAAGRKIIIFVDHYIPKHDRDAGSKAAYDFIEFLVEKNYFVIFWPDNLYPDPDYYESLSDLGVMVISGAQYRNQFMQFLGPYTSSIERIFISRPHIAHQFLAVLDEDLKEKTMYIGHDIHYERMRREYEKDLITEGREWLIYSDTDSIAQFRTQEVLLWKGCKESLYFTQRECDIVEKVTEKKAGLIPLYSHKRVERLMEKGGPIPFDNRNLILYVGGFAHSPNLDAMNWLLQDVKKGDSWLKSFLVVGSKIPELLKEKFIDLGINYQSDISNEELEELHLQSKLVLAPLRFGSGLKGKVIEAIASCVPVISTSIGMEGLTDFGKAQVFDEVESFVKAIETYSIDQSAWQDLQKSQLTLLEQYLKSARYENALELEK